MKINLNFNWNWNKIGLAVSILILVAMLILWALFASYGYYSYCSMVDDETNIINKTISNALIGLLLYVVPIILMLKNIKLLAEIFKTQRKITREDMLSILYLPLPFYILIASFLLIGDLASLL